MNFEKKFLYGLKKLKEAEIFNTEFSSQMLTNLTDFFGVWKIGVIVTCKERLIKRFGADDYENEIHPRLLRLAFQLKAIILDVCTDDFNVVDKRIKALRGIMIQLIDNRIKVLEQGLIKPLRFIRRIRYIQIIGDHDIIPFAELPNNTGDGDILYTDDVYADFTGDEVIDVPIARIPDGKSLDLLKRQLDRKSKPKPGAFGLANSLRPYAGPIMDIFDDAADVYWSLPMTSDDFSVSDVDVEYVYFILHGSDSDTSVWWGDPTLPIAFETNLAACHGTLLTGCCYGAYIIDKIPADSICLRFLRSGIKAFIGCTGLHYSTFGTQTNDYGPLFHKLFFEYLMAGNRPSRAFLKTKRAYAELADSNIEDKILHEFVFYGRL